MIYIDSSVSTIRSIILLSTVDSCESEIVPPFINLEGSLLNKKFMWAKLKDFTSSKMSFEMKIQKMMQILNKQLGVIFFNFIRMTVLHTPYDIMLVYLYDKLFVYLYVSVYLYTNTYKCVYVCKYIYKYMTFFMNN
jgi:hypothetical protein